MEAAIKKKSPPSPHGKPDGDGEVHLVYFLFLWMASVTLTVGLLFWIDIVPHFGTSDSISQFAEKYLNYLLAKQRVIWMQEIRDLFFSQIYY